ncbi:MAG: hypothetical protein WBM50_13405 [Acidimicrobiales bacterium]
MTRRVRYLDPESLAVDIALALPDARAAERFASVDLPAALDQLAVPGLFEALELGAWPGRRLVVEPGQTVGAFSVFVEMEDDGGLVVYAVDIWPGGFPEDP